MKSYNKEYLLKNPPKSIKDLKTWELMGEEYMAFIEVEVDETKLEEGTDHSPMMVKLFRVGKSFLSPKPISKSRIKKVHYIKFNKKTE